MDERREDSRAFTAKSPAADHHTRWLTLVLLVTFIVVTLGGFLAVVAYDHYANRRAAEALSDDVLAAVQRHTLSELESFLGTASSMSTFLSRLAQHKDRVSIDDAHLDQVASDLLRTYRQLAMFNIADTHGQFLMPKKMPDGSVDTKRITIQGGVRSVTWTRRDRGGQVVSVEQVEDDQYDPRVRPWYRGAVEAGGLFWTDLYIFFTDRQPGITAASPVYGKDGELIGVLGLDIELRSLSHFLAGLRVGEHGYAVIATRDGHIIAHPDPAKTLREEGGTLVPARVSDVGEPALQRAFDQFRIDGPGKRLFRVDGEAYISLATELPDEFRQPWIVLLVVPESDFVGIVGANSRRSVLLSLLVVCASGALGGLLIVQSVRANRRAVLANARYHRLETRTDAIATLAASAGAAVASELTDDGRMLASAAAIVGSPRVSLWHTDRDRRLLVLDLVHEDGSTQPGGLTFPLDEVEQFAAIARGSEPVVVRDTMRSRMTAGLAETYLKYADVRSMLIVPVPGATDADHMLVCEHCGRSHDWMDDQVKSAVSAAEILAARHSDLGPAESPADVQSVDAAPEPAPADDGLRAAVRDSLASLPSDDDWPEARRIRSAAVIVAIVRMPTSTKREYSSRAAASYDSTVRLVQRIAQTYAADIQQWQGDRFVAVFEPQGDQPDLPRRVVDMAVCLVEEIERCAEAPADKLTCKVGIDIGQVLVWDSEAGPSPNIRGAALRVASMLAQSAAADEVQLSGEVERQLPAGSCYRRGAYFVEGLGELDIYGIGQRAS